MTFLAIHIFLALDGSCGYVITACSRIMVSALDQLAEIRTNVLFDKHYCLLHMRMAILSFVSRLLSLQNTFNMLLQKSSACLAFVPEVIP